MKHRHNVGVQICVKNPLCLQLFLYKFLVFETHSFQRSCDFNSLCSMFCFQLFVFHFLVFSTLSLIFLCVKISCVFNILHLNFFFPPTIRGQFSRVSNSLYLISPCFHKSLCSISHSF